jgi:hypothetical protein
MADDTVKVRRSDLEHVQSELRRTLQLFDEVSNERPHISMLEKRISAMLSIREPAEPTARPSLQPGKGSKKSR